MKSVLIWLLIGCTAALPFAAFGLDLLLLIVIPAALVAGWLAWRLLALFRDNDAELNERLARHYARRAVKLHLHAQRQRRALNSEVHHG